MIEYSDFEIDKYGHFSVKRNGAFITQYCPYNTKTFNHCGYACPMFHMPVKSPSQSENGKIFYHVHVCNEKEFLGEFKNDLIEKEEPAVDSDNSQY